MEKDRVNLILKNKNYISYLKEIDKCERNREFCKHNLKHFLDVARIAYIICLEKKLEYKKDLIYAIGLLHDIGRGKQYKYDIPHNEASHELALPILKECEFNDEEIEVISRCILNHRNNGLDDASIENIIYKSDKISRECFNCKAIDKCNWDKNKQNSSIIY